MKHFDRWDVLTVNPAVDCSTKWDGSEFQSPTVRSAKKWRHACVEEPTARNLN